MKAQPLSPPLSLQTYPFQRGSSRFRLRKVTKKTRLTLKHILIIFILAGALSYLTSQFFLFLTTWEGLRIQQIQVRTGRPEVENEIRNILNSIYGQNILKLDLYQVEKTVLDHRWVKKAKVRKIFPSALEIIIEERQPIAVFKMSDLAFLIDEDGTKLEPISPDVELTLPFISLADETRNLSKEDMQVFKECLQALNPEERHSARLFLYTYPVNLILQFRHDSIRLVLGKDHFQEKIHLYRTRRPLLEVNFGPIEYMDLRFWEDRIYFKLKEPFQASNIIDAEEET